MRNLFAAIYTGKDNPNGINGAIVLFENEEHAKSFINRTESEDLRLGMCIVELPVYQDVDSAVAFYDAMHTPDYFG
jgi:hypothetical protein